MADAELRSCGPVVSSSLATHCLTRLTGGGARRSSGARPTTENGAYEGTNSLPARTHTAAGRARSFVRVSVSATPRLLGCGTEVGGSGFRPEDLHDAARTRQLRNVYASIGAAEPGVSELRDAPGVLVHWEDVPEAGAARAVHML